MEAGLALTLPAGDGLELFGGGGLGYYFFDADANVNDEVGYYLAAGVEKSLRKSGHVYGQTETRVFAEILYRSVSADDVIPEEDDAFSDADLDGFGTPLDEIRHG